MQRIPHHRNCWPAYLLAILAASAHHTILAEEAAPDVSDERLTALLAGEAPSSVAELRAMEARFQEVAEKVLPATVAVRAGGGSGSGVIIGKEGYVLTAGHVSGKAGRDVAIVFQDGRSVKGKTLGANFGIDSGLIKIEEDGEWPYVEMGKSAELKQGQWVLAVGHPGGFQNGRTSPVRVGRVLNNGRTSIVTDCALVGGDSGGPLFDMDGNVVGIHSRIGGSLVANVHVPVDTFSDTWDRLVEGETWGGGIGGPRRGGPFVGVVGDPSAAECKIAAVQPDSPADKAGIKEGDVIEKFDGKPVKDFAELARLVRSKKPGDEVVVEIRRGDETKKLDLKIGKFSEQS